MTSFSVLAVIAVTCIVYKVCKPSLWHMSVYTPIIFSTTTTVPRTLDSVLVQNDRIRYKHTKRRLPGCIVIGIRKAGTRALITFIDLHSQVRTARNEVHFFDNDDNYSQGMEWYRKKMPYSFPGQVTMEKTPAYFVCEYVPERIYKMNSTIKLLVIVRDPVSRTISDYLQIHLKRMAQGKSHASFEELAINPETGDIDKSYNPIRRSIYYRYMKQWLEVFPREQVHIVNGERLIKHPLSELRKIETFLGLEHKITEENFYFNETRGFYCLRNETGQKCLSKSKGREHPKIDPVILSKLRAFFRPYNYRFYRLVGHDYGWD